MLKRAISIAALGCVVISSASMAGRTVPETLRQGDLALNDTLTEMDMPFQLAEIEFITAEGSEFMGGKLVFYKDVGNKSTAFHYVKGDPRRSGEDDIQYITDLIDGVANGANGPIDAVTTTMLIDEGMAHWNEIGCSDLPITNVGAFAADLGILQWFWQGGPFPGIFADVTHAGWLPPAFFDFIAGPGGGDGILGVTATFSFGTDVDGDGKVDTAFAEIYMNNGFEWEVGNEEGRGPFDIRSTMFHEQGHSLSQGHFGQIALNKRGKLIISPKRGGNLMLAAGGSNSEWEGFHGSDIGGHCSIWGEW